MGAGLFNKAWSVGLLQQVPFSQVQVIVNEMLHAQL